MTVPDLINGLFELFGGVLLCLNIRRLYRDKTLKGVSWIPVAFFAAWGFWNLYFYPAVGCWLSFAGGTVVVTANSIWLAMVWWYWWKPRHHALVGQRLKITGGSQDGEEFTVKEVREETIAIGSPSDEIRQEVDQDILAKLEAAHFSPETCRSVAELLAAGERLKRKAEEMSDAHP
ncbi:MAG: hypothetical protein ABFE07_28825 [Armatimonadia bacterium]